MEAPKLRFKGFTDSWLKTNLGIISTDISYGLNAAAKPYDGVNKYIRITDIQDHSGEFIPNPLTSPDIVFVDERYKLKLNDICFARTGASVGKSYLYKEKDGNLCFAGFLIKFSIIKNTNSFFISKIIQRRNYWNWVQTVSKRSGQPGINAEEFKSFEFLLPTFKEQQKIADFLQTADERIALLKQKKELMESYKKGAVQKIFFQELKFKKGSRWNQIKVHEIYRNIPTNSLSRNDLNYNCGTVKNIHYGDIHTIFKTHLNTTYENIPYINQEIKLRYTSSSYCTPGDIIFADASEDVKDIGKCVEIIEVNSDHLVAGLHTIHFRPITQLIAKGFAGYLFRSPNVVRQIQKESQGAKVLGISASKLLNLSVVIPEIHEQEMIVDFLIKLDDKIYTIEKQLKLAELWKKGLLQQMFV